MLREANHALTLTPTPAPDLKSLPLSLTTPQPTAAYILEP